MAKLFASEAGRFCVEESLPHPRRLRLLQGVRDRAPLPRRAAAADRRGHVRDPAHGHRQEAAAAPQDLERSSRSATPTPIRVSIAREERTEGISRTRRGPGRGRVRRRRWPMPAATTCYSCKVGSAFYGNNAWAGANNAGAGDPAFTAPDTTCANVAGSARSRSCDPGRRRRRTRSRTRPPPPPRCASSAPADTRIHRLRARIGAPLVQHAEQRRGYNLLAVRWPGAYPSPGQLGLDRRPAIRPRVDRRSGTGTAPALAVDSGLGHAARRPTHLRPSSQGAAGIDRRSHPGCFDRHMHVRPVNGVDRLPAASARASRSRTTSRPRTSPPSRPGRACSPPGVRSGDEPVTFSASLTTPGIRRAVSLT